MVAGETVARLRAHRGAIAANPRNHSHRGERVEVENGQPLFEGRHLRPRLRRRLRLRRAARDVQPPAVHVREDVISAALSADVRGLEDFIGAVGARLEGESCGRQQRAHDNRQNGIASHLKPP